MQRQINGWKKLNLKGKIKSINVTKWQAVKNFFRIKKRKKYGSHTITFNDKGNQIEKNKYNENGSIVLIYTFTYDEKENLIREEWQDQDMIEKIVQYDSFLESIQHWDRGDRGGCVTYKYDYRGNLIEEEIHYNRDGPFSRTTYKYRYDTKGITEKYTYEQYNNICIQNDSFIYNDIGNLIAKETRFVSNRDSLLVIVRDEYEYDDKGNLIKEKKYSTEGRLYRKCRFKYTFDKNLNWIKKITLDTYDKRVAYIEEREIEYFSGNAVEIEIK